MKRPIAYLLLIGLMCIAVACTKDGKFNPSEKIEKVYSKASLTVSHVEEEAWITDTTILTAKHMTEQWFWDGKKLVAIAYYNIAGKVERTVKFDYDGSQLTKAYSDANNYIELTYDGRKVTNATVYTNGHLSADYQFTHEKSKISQIDIKFPSVSKGFSPAPFTTPMEETLWQLFMPCDARVALQPATNGDSKAAFNLTVTLTWEGKNVSKTEVESNGRRYTTDYTYDEKHNPYRGFLYSLITGGETTPLAKNNVLTATITNADGTTETTTYTYAYDGNWPIARGCGRTLSTDSYRSVETETLYIEYAE